MNSVIHRPYSTPIFAALLLAGCAITKVDPPPPVTATAQFKETGAWQQANAAVTVSDKWWTLFNDPVLDDLQNRLVIDNENLKVAAAQVANARAVLEASRSAMYPTLSAGLSATREGSPSNTPSATAINSGISSGSGNVSNSFSLTANANWEVDLWGRLAQASAGAQSSLQASMADLASARLSAQATLTQTYFSLRTIDAQLSLSDRSIDAYQRSVVLTQARYDGGVAGRSDLLQAQTQLKSAQAQRADLTAQRAQLAHAIAVLVGTQPAALAITHNDALPVAPLVPVMLPSNLLERRPDIAAAQRRVATAYSQIGVADAAYFPALSLSASGGYRGTSMSDLISAPHLFWSLGSSLTQAIFDGGQRKLASAQARANAEQLTANYRQVVLTALQEVEDNLILNTQLQQEAQLQAEAVQAAQRNLEITQDQYRAGTVSYLNVVIAQTSAFSSESSLLSTRNRQLAAISQLLKNIAGRWDT
ncbi:efflux transporter outer membrane subunit [Undibacterium sp. TJN19]|uniref:efflux transporter outer membrane subunit n=1 Tax=Undibacterium sp. TJN19 TaxID=3413055 RepID=UPI003BF2EEEB